MTPCPPPRQMSTLGHRNSIFFIGTSKSRHRNLILIFYPLSNDIFCVANGSGCMEIQGAVYTPFLSLFRLLDVNNSSNLIETCNFFHRNLILNLKLLSNEILNTPSGCCLTEIWGGRFLRETGFGHSYPIENFFKCNRTPHILFDI